MMKIILTRIFIFIFAILFCASIDCLLDLYKSISQFIEKRKRKKIIKKLKEMPTLDQVATNLLKYSKEEEKNDRN